ncbi:MAG: NnrS family protein, partial [Actinomycetota bacterium]|nr:NnrS family protein [Actinomycetota bacterium]
LFTRNALRRSGVEAAIESNVRVGAIALTVAGIAFALDLASPGSALGAWLALAAAPLLIARQLYWQPRYALGRPILWVLHVGHAWVAVGFACHAASVLGGMMPLSAALHAFTSGAMGCMILGMMTRVSLGHTGRPVEASALTTVAYVAVIAAALVRVFGVAFAPAASLFAYQLSGAAFAAGYAIFVLEFTPILWRARTDA